MGKAWERGREDGRGGGGGEGEGEEGGGGGGGRGEGGNIILPRLGTAGKYHNRLHTSCNYCYHPIGT